MAQTTEQAFESTVEAWLLGSGGWQRGGKPDDLKEWDPALALFPARVLGFLRETQPALRAEFLDAKDLKPDALLPKTHEERAYTAKHAADPEWTGFSGYFRFDPEIDRFVEELAKRRKG